jgi:ribosomal protein S27AE
MGFFSFLSNKLRCPNCGFFANHPKKIKTEEDKKIDEMMMNFLPKDSLMYKVKEDMVNNDNYQCEKCLDDFTKQQSETWKNIANKHGERVALDEYKKS